jgi:hypothetical protein
MRAPEAGPVPWRSADSLRTRTMTGTNYGTKRPFGEAKKHEDGVGLSEP